MVYLYDGPSDSQHVFLFAHGAGGAMDTVWMSDMAKLLGDRGIRVVRFEFPYMAARRGPNPARRAPDRQLVLLDTFRKVVEEHGGGAKVAIGGKSMGGRMATMVADELQVRGVVCFGYPFHPPGKPEQLRTAHLETLKTPTLILQGVRDDFGNRDDVSSYKLSRAIRVEWLEDGDHSFKPRKGAGCSLLDNLLRTAGLTEEFLTALISSRT